MKIMDEICGQEIDVIDPACVNWYCYLPDGDPTSHQWMCMTRKHYGCPKYFIEIARKPVVKGFYNDIEVFIRMED